VRSRSMLLEAIARHAAERPSATALADIGPEGDVTASLTWREFATAAAARAGIISSVAPLGTTVLAALPTGIDLAVWIVGAIDSGVRLVLMHPRSGPAEVAAVRGRTGSTVVVAADELLIRVDEAVVRLQVPVQALSTSSVPTRLPNLSLAEPGSLVLGSSGTTGLPKLVRRESEALDADARAVAGGLILNPADHVLCVPPLTHSYGIDVLLGTLLSGATLRLMSEFDAIGAARQLADGVTVLPGVPFVYEALARIGESGGAGNFPRHELRIAVSAGSRLSPRVRREFTNLWKIGVGQLYGATELGTVSVNLPHEPSFDPESIGRPLPGVSFRILDVDEPSRILRPGVDGHLAVRAPSMLSGYVDGNLDLIDGHLATGDLARIDSSGRATITGRLKQLIDSGGFKVNPLEVESVLSEHPGVAECAVVPLELSDSIQRLAAFVVPKNPERPPADSDLRQFLRERLAPTKIPRRFDMLATLPRSPLGKLQREKLPRGNA